MEKLPDELINHILDCTYPHASILKVLTSLLDLTPTEIVLLQAVSRRFLTLARDGSLWRFQCYYDSPKATLNRIGQTSWTQALTQALVGEQKPSSEHTCMSNKARAADEWDLSDPSEKVDWYSEYISRHAQLSATWLNPQSSSDQDIRGVALLEDDAGRKLVGPLEDGSICVWDFQRKEGAPSRHAQICPNSVQSPPGIVYSHATATSASSQSAAKRALPLSGVIDCISIDQSRKRAYLAVGDLLNEVDLATLQVVSQAKYAWPITALSPIQSPYQPLTVGTSFSLHILDPRSAARDRSSSPGSHPDLVDSVAFFPNKDVERNIHPARRFQMHPLDSFRSTDYASESQSPASSPTPYTQGRRNLVSYAPLEPAPLSILHQTDHSIMVAGRFPSILNYDRRYFPRLEYVIHSSARLSALAYLPFSPRGIKDSSSTEPRGTLISCGEYNGRGSLELYSVPHNTWHVSSDSSSNETCPMPTDLWSDTTSSASDMLENTSPATAIEDSTTAAATTQTQPRIYSYQNRQSISSAKLLSVATQGTRIVFSDADGALKWVERDGKSVARRWNINSYQPHQESFPRMGGGASSSSSSSNRQMERFGESEEVVRKIIPTGSGEADDLLVWTGERVGLVSFGRNEEFYDAEEGYGGKEEVVRKFDGFVGPRMLGDEGAGGEGGGQDDLEEKAREYDRRMRRVLERQADELNWMHRFGFGSSS